MAALKPQWQAECIEEHASSSATVNLAPGALNSDSRAVQQSCAQMGFGF